MIWEVGSVEYKEALQDYDDVLARPSEAWRGQWAHGETFTPLGPDASRLAPEVQDTLFELSMRPVVATEAASLGVEGEYWIDPSGGLVVELALQPAKSAGSHFVSSYFTDVSGFTVHPSDSPLCDAETPPRRNIRGADDLRTDIETGMQLMAEKRAEGVRTLAVVDVHTAELREQVYAKFIVPNPYKVAADAFNPEVATDLMAQFRKQLLRKFGLGSALVIIVVLGLCFAFGMAPLHLLLLGILMTMIAFGIGRALSTSLSSEEVNSEISKLSPDELMEMAKEAERIMKESEEN